LLSILSTVAAYLLGSFPTGYLIVRWSTGQDVRDQHSGRSGGTNALRAAGFWAGLVTAGADMAKAALAVTLARWLLPAQPLVHVAAGLLAILGHNYSIFLLRRQADGWRWFGGAGGAPTVGAAIGLWWPSVLIMIPAGVVVLWVVGYASLATLTVGLAAIVLFLWRGLLGVGPLEYTLFGIGAASLLTWSLRPNIRRLIEGTERLVGLRARGRDSGPSED